MKTAHLILTVSLTVLVFCANQAIAELAAPHNAVNNIGCANYCHILPTVKSPYWDHVPADIDDTPTNHLCNSCHTANSGPFSMVNAPAVKTHSSLTTDTDYGNWTIGCTDCHSPHFQEQLQWAQAGETGVFLATGIITNFLYDGVGETLLTLDPGSLQYKAGWDAARLAEKTAQYRRTVLLPDRLFRETDQSGSLSFQVVAVDELANTITVKGDVTPVYEKTTLPSEFGIIYGQLVRQSVKRNGFTTPVKFFDTTSAVTGGFTDQWDTGFPRGICQVCHTQTAHWSPAALAAGDVHYPGEKCTECHTHESGFAHGGARGGTGCEPCHGHDAGYEYSPGLFSQGRGTTWSHSTHTENDVDDLRGPALACAACHNTTNFPYFASGSGTDADGDGLINLDETNVCNPCHSPGGPFDGVNDAVIGAKSNWTNGVYSGNSLKSGKEKWCVTCHDSGTSVIGGRQAPDVAGNNGSYGYYRSGHGYFLTECGGCHGLAMDHNFDGVQTYDKDFGSLSYKQGFRLRDVNGQDPMNVPDTGVGCDYTSAQYGLCLSCHSEQALFQDMQSSNMAGCGSPYKNAASVITSFSERSSVPAVNLHWYHLGNVMRYDSDGDGVLVGDSWLSCMGCHNPHGEAKADNTTPTVRMTKGELNFTTGTDGTGDYGEGPGAVEPCSWCHGASPSRYYRDEPAVPNPTRPDTPVNASPANGATGVFQPPTLSASAFSDAEPSDTHQASQWLISSSSGDDFTANLLYDSGVVAASNSHDPNFSWASGTTYYWKVRYLDNHGIWSYYSAETNFTILTNALPARPVNQTPAAGALDVARSVTLSASAFSDADAADTHQASVWQISTGTGNGFAAGLVYASGAIAPSTSHVVPVQLAHNTRYYWRTRYQDSKGQWSAISAETSFVTTSLISRYTFDSVSGATVNDAQGVNNGLLRNGAGLTAGFTGHGQGLLLDGINDDMFWSYADGTPANTFTIEAMVKASAPHEIDPSSTAGTGGISGQKYLFGANHVAGTGAGAGISMGTNGISVYEHSAGYMPALAVYDPAPAAIGTGWNHVVVTYTGKLARIYLNGHLAHTGLASPKDNVFAPTQLGAGAYGAFAGVVDEVAIYSKALTRAEILKRCLDLGQCVSADVDNDGVADAADNCLFEHNPDQADLNNDGTGNVCDYQGYWRLEDGSGTTAANETGENTATVAGFDNWTTGVGGGSALAFNGFNTATVANILDNHAGNFSISVWLKFPTGAINPGWSMGKGDAYRGTGFGIAHWVDTDTPVQPGLFLNDGTKGVFLNPEWQWPHRVSLYASSIPRGTWGHFVWTVDRTNNVMKVYKNGQYENQTDISILGANPVTGSTLFDFGTAATNNKYAGTLDNVAVYDFVLQPADVLARCRADAGVGNCP